MENLKAGIHAERPRSHKKDFLLSVIVPCYNEEEVIRETYKRISDALNKKNFKFEIVFCDDGSTDTTAAILEEISLSNPNCKTLILSRNFGHQFASFSGIENCDGDAVILIDADLQDPPELIIDMVDKWKDGWDVVYGQRLKRQDESWFKRFTASAFYRLFNQIADIKIPLDTGDFRLMDRRVVEILLKMPEKDKFLRGMISWIGLKQTSLLYTRDPRYAGSTKYGLIKMLKFAASGIFSFSTMPLRFATWLGLTTATLSVFGIAYIFYVRLFMDNWVEGWAFTSVLIMFFGGIQLFTFGIMGEYVGRIYRQDKKRPQYIIDRTIKI